MKNLRYSSFFIPINDTNLFIVLSFIFYGKIVSFCSIFTQLMSNQELISILMYSSLMLSLIYNALKLRFYGMILMRMMLLWPLLNIFEALFFLNFITVIYSLFRTLIFNFSSIFSIFSSSFLFYLLTSMLFKYIIS